MRHHILTALGLGLFTHTAMAGVMQAGMWEISTTYIAAAGPGVGKAVPTEPVLTNACMAQSFVDKENYTSVDFSMERLQRNGFECTVDSKSGDTTEAKWKYTCKREDGFTVDHQSDNWISPAKFRQDATEVTKKDRELWSRVTIRIDGRFLGEKCEPTLFLLR